MKVPGGKIGEAAFQVESRQRALHQALSLCRASFRVYHSLTFNTVGGEEEIGEYGVIYSWWSYITVFPVNLIVTLFHIFSTLSQPLGEKMVKLISEGLMTFITRRCLAFSHALDNL